jgi:hypothetical protein
MHGHPSSARKVLRNLTTTPARQNPSLYDIRMISEFLKGELCLLGEKRQEQRQRCTGMMAEGRTGLYREVVNRVPGRPASLVSQAFPLFPLLCLCPVLVCLEHVTGTLPLLLLRHAPPRFLLFLLGEHCHPVHKHMWNNSQARDSKSLPHDLNPLMVLLKTSWVPQAMRRYKL